MRKFLLTAIATASLALSVTPAARAYTIDEIIANGEFAIANYKYTASIYPGGSTYCQYYAFSEGLRFEKIDDTHVLIKGFQDEDLDFVFTLYNGSSEATDGTQLKVQRGTYAQNSKAWGISTTNRNQTYFVLNISKNGDQFKFSAPYPLAFLEVSGSQGSATIFTTFDTFNIETYTPNAWISDNVRTYDFKQTSSSTIDIFEASRKDRLYPAKVTVQDGKFSILNLGDNGYGYDRETLFEVGGTIDADNKLTFNKGQFAKSALLYDANDWWGVIPGVFEYRLMGLAMLDDDKDKIDSSKGGVDELYGTYEPEALAHNTVSHAWVTNDGLRRTYEDFKMNIDSYTYYCNYYPYNALNILSGYHNTQIQGNNDVTVDVELTLKKVGADASQIGVWGEIETKANHQNVDHYELYVVPGKFNSINDVDFSLDLSLGHVDAESIHEYDKESHKPVNRSIAFAAESSENVRVNDYSFGKLIPFSDLGNKFTPNSKAYTFFVKTVYKPETNLSPTFHSMQYVDDSLVTGIDELEMNMEDADAPVEYYNMMGVRVAEPVEGEIYIRRQGTRVEKVRM